MLLKKKKPTTQGIRFSFIFCCFALTKENKKTNYNFDGSKQSVLNSVNLRSVRYHQSWWYL